MAERFRVAGHVRACVDLDCVIFLDLRRDRYWGAPSAALAGLAGIDRSTEGPEGGADAKLIGRLLQMKLIEASAAEPSNMCDRIARPCGDLSDLDAPADATSINWRDWVAFAWACLSAAHAIASRRLDIAFRRLAAKKRRARRDEGEGSCAPDAERFTAMRPWFPARRVCLFDSLALMNFLIGRGQSAELVMAVRARPFAAHCWVEEEGIILNDALDRCRFYTPIMRV